jgi:hypothetical protein
MYAGQPRPAAPPAAVLRPRTVGRRSP